MGAGHKRNKFVPMAAIETSAAAAFVQHAVQKQLVDLSWYHASILCYVTQINCRPFFATRIASEQESTPDLIIAARSFFHMLLCRLQSLSHLMLIEAPCA